MPPLPGERLSSQSKANHHDIHRALVSAVIGSWKENRTANGKSSKNILPPAIPPVLTLLEPLIGRGITLSYLRFGFIVGTSQLCRDQLVVPRGYAGFPLVASCPKILNSLLHVVWIGDCSCESWQKSLDSVELLIISSQTSFQVARIVTRGKKEARKLRCTCGGDQRGCPEVAVLYYISMRQDIWTVVTLRHQIDVPRDIQNGNHLDCNKREKEGQLLGILSNYL